MAALKNGKHELFAQGLAKGKSQAEAYESAGYAPSEPNASRLTRNDKVRSRVLELQERAAVRAEITVADITARLLAIAAKGEQSSDAPLLQAARASLMDVAKLNGMIVDKSKVEAEIVDRRVSSEPLSETEWETQHGLT